MCRIPTEAIPGTCGAQELKGRYWVQAEIEFAQAYGKPIVGVMRRGQERTPQAVYDVANEVVAWNGAQSPMQSLGIRGDNWKV